MWTCGRAPVWFSLTKKLLGKLLFFVLFAGICSRRFFDLDFSGSKSERVDVRMREVSFFRFGFLCQRMHDSTVRAVKATTPSLGTKSTKNAFSMTY